MQSGPKSRRGIDLRYKKWVIIAGGNLENRDDAVKEPMHA